MVVRMQSVPGARVDCSGRASAIISHTVGRCGTAAAAAAAAARCVAITSADRTCARVRVSLEVRKGDVIMAALRRTREAAEALPSEMVGRYAHQHHL